MMRMGLCLRSFLLFLVFKGLDANNGGAFRLITLTNSGSTLTNSGSSLTNSGCYPQPLSPTA